MEDQRDVLGEVLNHLGLDPSTIPAATLDAVRESLEGPVDPRALAARVGGFGHGGVRGYAQPRPTSRRVDLEGLDLEALSPRELAERLVPKQEF